MADNMKVAMGTLHTAELKDGKLVLEMVLDGSAVRAAVNVSAKGLRNLRQAVEALEKFGTTLNPFTPVNTDTP
jgi:hypothetical protein